MTAYIEREIRYAIEQALKTMPVVVITGMRQTGKTTFLKNDPLFKKYRYISLDDFAVLKTALSEPEALIASGNYFCIDEAQKAPELMTAIKIVVDLDRTPGKFVLSGSANFSLLKNISESLAGRAVYFTMQPFSRREIKDSVHKRPFLVHLLTGKIELAIKKVSHVDAVDIIRGGMPPVRTLSINNVPIWFRGFEQTYLERDIRDLARIDDMLGFHSFIKLSALRSGQLLNLSQLARDSRLSLATATRYLHLAETSFLFKRLSPFLRNRSSRLIKSPKLYVVDSGLAYHLTETGNLDNESNEPMRGALFETYTFQNLLSILDAYLPDAHLYYWHVQGRHEIDFIFEYKKDCIAVELKASRRWSENDLKSLKTFLELTSSCRAAILAYNGTEMAKIGKNLWVIPLATLLS